MAVTDGELTHSEEIREIWKLFRETDEKFRRTDEKFRRTDEKFRRTDEKFRRTDEKFEETRNLVYALTGKWSRFVEGLVAPAAIRMFEDRGIKIEHVSQRVRVRRNGDEIEIDILGVNNKDVLAVEVKSTLGVEDVKEHIERLGKFRRFFPEYKDKQLLGAVAGIVFEGDSDRFAYKQGLYVIGQTGDTVRILNDEKFEPKRW